MEDVRLVHCMSHPGAGSFGYHSVAARWVVRDPEQSKTTALRTCRGDWDGRTLI